MADSTRLVIELQTVLRNLDRTLRGLDQIKRKLDAVASVKFNQRSSTATDRAALSVQRLANQQKKLEIQSQELANRQEKARQTTERLNASQQRLSQTAVKSARKEAEAEQTRGVRAQEFANRQERARQATERLQRSSQKLTHVLGEQQDAHVRAFRAMEKQRKSALTLDQTLGRVGGSLRNLGLGLTSLGSSLTLALTAPLTAIGVLATRNAVTLDSLNRGLIAITGSADEAGQQLARLTNIAKLPGIGFQEAIQGSIRLQAVGFSAEKAEKALIQFSNAVALTGGGRAELDRITVQLGQLAAKGKVLSQDLKPIIEAGPAVGRALKEAFGTVNAQDIQELGLSSEQFLDQLVKQLEQLPRAAAGFRNTFDNFADSVFRVSAAIGEAIIPVLTKLIDIAEPVLIRLAAGFKALPGPVQTLIVVFGGLLAALGPTLFIVGQFATGIGGVIAGVGRMIAVFRLAVPAIQATTAALTAQQAVAAATAATLGVVALAVGAIVAVAAALLILGRRKKDVSKIDREQLVATEAQIASIKSQIKFVDGLNKGVRQTGDEQRRLTEIYESLNAQARIRITAAGDEEKRLVALRAELQRLLELRKQEQIQQAANLAANLASTAADVQANERSRDSVAERVQANTALAESIRATGRISAEQAKQVQALNLTGLTAQQVIDELARRNNNLIESQGELIKSSKELNGTAEEQGATLRILQRQTGLSARELLTAAKAMGVFKGDVEATLPTLERFITVQERATDATDAFTRALAEQSKELLRAGEDADIAEKRRKALIDAAASLAREASTSFAGALKFMRAFIAAQPELAAAIQKELQLQQKSMDEFLDDLLRKGASKSGSQLRNAQEQLASALLGVSEARKEKELARERAGNEALLEENELSFARQLTAYRQYLERRAELTDASLAKELGAQLQIAFDARAAQTRLLGLALKSGISETERVKRRTQAAAFEERALQAETKAAEIESERVRIAGELKRALAEASIQQIRDVRQLDIEFAELQGNIEAALNARTAERFREQLQDLSKTQALLNAQLIQAKRSNDADKQEELRKAIALNQSQIELIELITQQELATNKLAAAQELVRRAQERQSQLEQDLAFQVEFRGLKEEDAIKARLDGEKRLADSLRVVRDLIQSEIDTLNAKGVKPPQALIDFIRDTSAAIKGLGELSFSEQFRLAEKEFDRLNDERLQKIQDVERAIRERDIAEAEGLLLIRRINGLYSVDLEEQVRLLKEIAAASNDASLQRQAQSAEQTVKDANEELASFNRQLRSASIDALQAGLTDFFASIGDRTRTAKEKLLDLVDSVVARINQVIAENLSKKLIESIFGDGTEESGILASVGRLFRLGGKGSAGGVGDVAAAGVTQVTQATAAATALTTGATAAATALTSAGVTAGASLVTSMTTAAASFSASIIAAGAAFAASVAASSAAQGVSSGLGSLGGAIGAAATGLFPSVPGGLVRIVEGGYPEAVLTTDPKHAARQVAILKAFLKETRGLGGRIRGLAAGGFTDRIDISAPQVSLSNVGLGELSIAGGSSTMKLRQVIVDQRDLGNWVNSSEGEQVLVDFLYRKSPVIRKIGGGK